MATVKVIEYDVKLDRLCRTCLSREQNLHSLNDVLMDSTTLASIITSTTGIQVEYGDGLPPLICSQCKEKALSALDFKKKSQESDTILRDLCISTSNIVLDDMQGAIKLESTLDVKHEASNEENDDNIFNTDYSFGNTFEENFDELGDLKDIAQCKLCHLVFDSEEALKDHIPKCVKVENSEDSSTYCPLCGICFNDAHVLTKHMWSKHANLMGPKKRGRPKKLLTSAILSKLSQSGIDMQHVKPASQFDCSICKEIVHSKQDLIVHWKEHRGMKVYCCILCKNMYIKKANFLRHLCCEDKTGDTNEKEDENECDNSQGTTNNTLNFSTEMSLESILDPAGDMDNMVDIIQICAICSAVFLSIEELLNHTDNEHPDMSQRCNICMKIFASIRTAARHRKLCKKIERQFECNTCGLKFAYEVSLNKHILRYHEGQEVSVKFMDSKKRLIEKKFPCTSCNRSFYRQELLDKHSQIHLPNAKKYECDVCSKKFFRPDTLRTHLQIHEPDHKKALNAGTCLCLYCGRSFSNSSNLIVHMRRHTGEKPYKCDFCDKGFPRSSDLQCHRRSHTGERPCVCSICGKGFSRSNKLSRHMRIHTGQRPYKCTYCDKAFSQSNDLKLHIRRHTGDKPYVCEICGDRFIQGTALQNHRRAHGHFPSISSDTHLMQDLLETKSIHNILNNEKKKLSHTL